MILQRYGDQAPFRRAVLVRILTPEADNVAQAASLEELERPMKTLGYEVVGTVSQRREGAGAGSLSGSSGMVGSMPVPWLEVTAKLDPMAFTMLSALGRLRGKDPWADFDAAAVPLSQPR